MGNEKGRSKASRFEGVDAPGAKAPQTPFPPFLYLPSRAAIPATLPSTQASWVTAIPTLDDCKEMRAEAFIGLTINKAEKQRTWGATQ